MLDVVLLGGGHTHLVAAPELARSISKRCRLTMIAPSARLLYSGMMPGWLAGQYAFDDCAIDLRQLCEVHDLRWHQDAAVDIDFRARRVICVSGANFGFDLLSVNVGSANDPGELAEDIDVVVLRAKPFAEFVDGWRTWCEASQGRPGARSLVVIGAGAAAVEIAFALARLVADRRWLAGSTVTLVGAGRQPLERLSAMSSVLARRMLQRRGVTLCLGRRYLGCSRGSIRLDDGSSLPADLVIVASGAQAPTWLTQAAVRDGLAVADDGGLAVDSTMRLISDPTIHASGDCASFVDQSVPKSGVHALRQAPTLARNLIAGFQRLANPSGVDDVSFPRRYASQRRSLALLNACDGEALGDWGPLGFRGRWVWRWKDRIDTRFIARFR